MNAPVLHQSKNNYSLFPVRLKAVARVKNRFAIPTSLALGSKDALHSFMVMFPWVQELLPVYLFGRTTTPITGNVHILS